MPEWVVYIGWAIIVIMSYAIGYVLGKNDGEMGASGAVVYLTVERMDDLREDSTEMAHAYPWRADEDKAVAAKWERMAAEMEREERGE